MHRTEQLQAWKVEAEDLARRMREAVSVLGNSEHQMHACSCIECAADFLRLELGEPRPQREPHAFPKFPKD